MFSTLITFSIIFLLVGAYNIKPNRRVNIDYDYSSESEMDSEKEEYDSMEEWRLNLREKLRKKSLERKVINSTGSMPPNRRLMIAEPIPPTAPDIDDIESLRARLEGKNLEDTSFVFSQFGAFGGTVWTQNNVKGSSMNDLQKVICTTDCLIAHSVKPSGFRGKDVLLTEEIIENHWKNMTEIERQFIKTVVDNTNHTRQIRSVSVATTGFFSSMFQVFAQWCTQNCDNLPTAKRPIEAPTIQVYSIAEDQTITTTATITTPKPEKITEASTPAEIATEDSTTAESTTEASTTEASTTEASTTAASTTEARTTEARITEASTAEATTTEASTTEASKTEASSSEERSTEKNTSEENLKDYESEESEEITERRFISNSGNSEADNITSKAVEPADISYQVKIPVAHLITQLFGEVISTLDEILLCVCGMNVTQICYCQPNNKAEPPLKLIPHI